MASLTTPERVAAKLHVGVPDEQSDDYAALGFAIADASALVLAHLDRDDVEGLRAVAQDSITAVATRVAARFWRNPQDIGSQSYGDMSISIPEPRVLTGDEQKSLSRWVRRVRGPIFLNPFPEGT